jgi:hypothetical protein
MSDRYIIFPDPAEFRDSYTKEIVKVKNEMGQMVDHPDRPFDWFVHAHLISHLQFSMDVGGYDAAKSAKEIAKAMEKAMDAGEWFMRVTADQHRRLMCCIARADDKHSDEPFKEKPNPKILAMSSHGMTRPMDNFTAQCFMDHMDAIANASTNKPEVVGD